MESGIIIRDATSEDFDIAHGIMCDIFTSDPAFSIFADDPKGLELMKSAYLKMNWDICFNVGTAHIAEKLNGEVVGVALWKASNIEYDTAVEELVASAGKYADRMLEISTITQTYNPPVPLYEMLIQVAVDSSVQGLGVGRKLIAKRIRELDKLGIPIYLEATTRYAAGGLYGRFGFQPVGEVMKFSKGVEVYPLWRNPRSVLMNPNFEDDVYPIIGNIVKFGFCNWRVLDMHDGRALLLSDKIVEQKEYHEKYEPVTWESCTLRKYLNGEFYNQFSENERLQIAETVIPNKENQWFNFGSSGDTEDKIFLLSIEETVRYFGDSGQLRGKNPNTKYYIDDAFNDTRKALLLGNNADSCWWLRTSGNSLNFAASVTANGRISVSGDFVNRNNTFEGGIRPALWLKL